MSDISLQIEELIKQGPLTIEETGTLVGSNYFSGGPVIRIRINLNEFNEVFTNTIPGFFEGLKKHVPSLEEHFCSYGVKGGFFKRVEEGTLLGHVVEHTALELQNLAGMDINFGKTRETKIPGVYNVVFRFKDQVAGLFAGKASAALINSILTSKEFSVAEVIEKLIEIKEARVMGFSTQSIADEASERGIPFMRLDKYNLVQLGLGIHRKIIRATVTENTSLIGVEMADNKFATSNMLYDAGVPVPKQILVKKSREALKFFRDSRKPLVVKPVTGRRGVGVSLGIHDAKTMVKAFRIAAAAEKEVIVQEQASGNLYRVLVINNKLSAATMLTPACVTGDGVKTIASLIDEFNHQPGRENGRKGLLAKIEIDADTLNIIALQDLTLETVLESGRKLVVKNTGNIRFGASSTDVTDKVHVYNKFVCERITRILNLDVVGIDIISPNISVPLNENQGTVIDVNAAPDFKVHICPNVGQPRLVQKDFLNMLFPAGKACRVPLISVTGSQGKSLYTSIIEKYYIQKGVYCGSLRTEGLFINGKLIKTIDLSHADSTSLLLKDPTIEAAVVETSVETILNSGLGYELADIGVVLNLRDREEYFTYDHIRDTEDVAYAKSVVAEQVYSEGYTILNAAEPLILEMTERLYSKPAFFSNTRPVGPLKKLMDEGSPVAFSDGNVLFISSNHNHLEICKWAEIKAITGTDEYLYEVFLAVAMTLFLLGEGQHKIKEILTGI